MGEFVPQRTAAYISQYDLHIAEMTVRETLAFSARCQGVGPRYGQNNLSSYKLKKFWRKGFELTVHEIVKNMQKC